jgi:hypothetical protein
MHRTIGQHLGILVLHPRLRAENQLNHRYCPVDLHAAQKLDTGAVKN